ncbi:hypothetical protein EVAR_6761_1 [Eumeta japonica]|uniref:Uncharacterized protein n=1 Tax=Eumeta variegata TaxID=151549 RepID=A0A4C1V3L9_EUMVA|nr:hypothetical protein EVAR_6761_1 [Eumeta japonica]
MWETDSQLGRFFLFSFTVIRRTQERKWCPRTTAPRDVSAPADDGLCQSAVVVELVVGSDVKVPVDEAISAAVMSARDEFDSCSEIKPGHT